VTGVQTCALPISDDRCALFDRSREWVLVFWDDEALVYVRWSDKFMDIIKKDGFRWLAPNELSMTYLDHLLGHLDLEQKVNQELKRSLETSPSHCAADIMNTKWSLFHHRTSEALGFAQDAVAVCPGRPDVYLALSVALEKTGQLPSSLKALEQAAWMGGLNERLINDRRDFLRNEIKRIEK